MGVYILILMTFASTLKNMDVPIGLYKILEFIQAMISGIFGEGDCKLRQVNFMKW